MKFYIDSPEINKLSTYCYNCVCVLVIFKTNFAIYIPHVRK